jgi:hypothetical protein
MSAWQRNAAISGTVCLIFRSIAVLFSIAAAPLIGQAASPSSPSPTPAWDQYLITWKMTANGRSKGPSDTSADFAFEASQSSSSEGQAVVNFDANGERMSGRILKGSLSYEIDKKTLPLSMKILCGPISVLDHDHYSLKTIEPMAGWDRPKWMYGSPRKQPDGSWLIGDLFSGEFFEGMKDPRFVTFHLSEGWSDRFHYEGGNAQLADVVTSGPIHSVCDSPALPPKLEVQDPMEFDSVGHENQTEPIQGFEVPNHFKMTSPTPDLFFKEWKFRVIDRGVGGTIPVEVDWKITVRRLGKCHVSGEILINDDPINPDINDEEIEMGVEHGSDSIDPDNGVASLNIRVTCDQVPIKKTLVNVKIDVQKNTGGHLHDASDRPVGSLNDIPVIGFSPAANSWWFRTDDDGRVHLTFKPGKADNDDRYGIAGIYRFTATPDPKRFPGRKAEVAVEAKVDRLSHLDADANYVNDIHGDSHTSGDNATAATKQRLHPFARAFHDAQVKHNEELVACGALSGTPPQAFTKPPQLQQWPIYPLWVIDVSLPFGGLYDDIHDDWSTPHQTHGRGDGVDFSVNNAEREPSSTGSVKWPGVKAKATVCDGYWVPPQGWLTMMMMMIGENYGDWDAWDLCHDPPKCSNEPAWHLHVKQ